MALDDVQSGNCCSIFNHSLQHTAQLLSVTAVRPGLGRAEEAEPLLQSCHAVLQSAFGDDFEAVGEAIFYLTLVALSRMPPSDIAGFNGQLNKARSRSTTSALLRL